MAIIKYIDEFEQLKATLKYRYCNNFIVNVEDVIDNDYEPVREDEDPTAEELIPLIVFRINANCKSSYISVLIIS